MVLAICLESTAAATLALAAAGRLAPGTAAFLAVGYLVAAASALVGVRRSGQRGLAFSTLMMPAYWPLLTWAACRAGWDLARRPHYWEKTRHGVTQFAAASGTGAREAADGEAQEVRSCPTSTSHPVPVLR